MRTLQRSGMSDVVVGTNSVSGTVRSAVPGLLYLSIPYSIGGPLRSTAILSSYSE